MIFTRVSSNILRRSLLFNVARSSFALRAFNTHSFPVTDLKNEVKQGESIDFTTKDTETVESIPWYLREEESSRLDNPIFKAEMPEIPITCPESTQVILNFMINKLGLDNFKVFDIRNLENVDNIPISSLGDIMIIADGKSEKHLQNAAQDLITYLKHEYNSFPYVEGLLKPNSMIRLRRRMKRRMMNKKITKDELFGVGINSWIMIDSKINNIFIHLLTPERRQLLNLEYLWCSPEEKDLYLPKVYSNYQVNGREIFDIDENDSIFKGLKRHYSINHQLALDELVLKNLENNDFQINEENLKIIKNDEDLSLNIMEGLLKKIENSTRDDLSEEDILKQYNELIYSIFPFNPSLKHYELLYEINSYFNYLNDKEFKFRNLVNILKNQNSAGISITKTQFSKFLNDLNNLLVDSKPLNAEELNELILLKFNLMFKILKIVNINNPTILNDDETKLYILKLSTQENLYDYLPNDYALGYHGIFENLVEFLYSNEKPSNEAIEFILITFLKTNQIKEFWEFWDNLNKVKINDDKLIIDDRPWDLLINLLLNNYKDNFVEVLVNSKLSFFVDLNLNSTKELNSNLIQILNKFDNSERLYPEIREYFK